MRRAWRAIQKKWPWSLPVHLKLDVLGFAIPFGPLARLNHLLRGKVPSRLVQKATKFYLNLPRTPR